MKRTSQKYHLKKMTVIDIVNKLFYQHGNGLDLQIKADHLVIDVSVIHSDDGKCYDRKDFYIQLQAGDTDTIKRTTIMNMQDALLRCDAEFEPINAWDRSIKV